MRLDKYLSHATNLSRALSRRAIKARRVLVNDKVITQSDFVVNETDQITLDGTPLSLPSTQYIMLHKPAGYVCATTDSEHPTVIDLLPPELAGVSIAGRLDKDTTGLVLLSDDGEWLHKISSPKHHHQKIYRAELAEPVTQNIIDQFAKGILLRNETKPTLPAKLVSLKNNSAQITLYEGRYHQVKRMIAACGNHVVTLHRLQVAHIVLDDNLAPGEYRSLTAAEINLSTLKLPT